MINCNPRISKFFGLPKIDKDGNPFSPINDYRNSVNYKLSKALNTPISSANQDLEFSNIKNSYKMMESLHDLQIPDDCMFVTFPTIIFWKRYVDDVFAIIKGNENDAEEIRSKFLPSSNTVYDGERNEQ